MEAVGVESGGNLLIVRHFNDLDKYFWQCFSFSRVLRDHYCPLLCFWKNDSQVDENRTGQSHPVEMFCNLVRRQKGQFV
jgi:hypothetical protein